jgi:hypothetical protein
MRTMISAALVVSLAIGVVVRAANAPSPQSPPAASATGATPAQDYRFNSGAGMLFFYVKPDKTAEFEAIVARIADVLEKSEDPIRKQQATTFKVLKSVESQASSAIYVFLVEPAIAGADYDPIKILGEALPADVQGLYERLRDATVKVERMGLTKIR